MIKAVDKSQAVGDDLGVKRITSFFGYDRSYYYKARKTISARIAREDAVLQLVHRERALQPRLGTQKVYHLLKAEFGLRGIKMGRDQLYDLLRRYEMLVEPRKKYAITTNSNHIFRRYSNLLKNRVLTGPNQAYVCDITYISTLEGFVYLCLIMDAYSRKIVGWYMHDTLEVEGCIQALKMAIRGLSKEQLSCLLHHSDHGIQYCCHAYRELLHRYEIQISMGEVGNCYENAQAERLNGILKQEYNLGGVIRSKALARELCEQAVKLYNNRRPHLSLGMCTPQAVHSGQAHPVVILSWSKAAQTSEQAA